MPAGDPDDCDRLFAELVSKGDLDGLMTLYEDDASSPW